VAFFNACNKVQVSGIRFQVLGKQLDVSFNIVAWVKFSGN